MKVFDVATRQVMQGGKKRGANMGILDVSHPDLMDFITCKTQDGEIANFNISVGISDDFMRAVEEDGDYEVVNPRNGELLYKQRARTVLNQIATLAWQTGDPGMIFLDTINKNNPLEKKFGRIVATNPCGEQPLHDFDACNLGSVNLANFVGEESRIKNPRTEAELPRGRQESRIDWERLSEVVKVAVRMLDNVIDVGTYPLAEIEKTVKANRRIGLGVMGWADMLYRLRISYGSEEGVKLAEKVMEFVQEKAWEASRELAEEKGVFPR